jgi:hypothetical protein
LIVHF